MIFRRQIVIAGAVIALVGGVALFWRITPKISAAPGAGRHSISSSKEVDSQPKPVGDAPVSVSAGVPQPSDSATDDELLKLAREMVSSSPQDALAWAKKQSNPKLRARMMQAVLLAWGEKFPDAAVNWATTQKQNDRQKLVEAALTGALRTQSATALEIAHRLLIEEPDFGGDCVGALVSKFSSSQHFKTASQLAAVAPEDFRGNWTRAVFRAWAQSRPEDAVLALDSIQDTKLHESVFKSVVNGWAAGAPASLATYAETLPAGADRQLALRQALDNWSLQDPAALGEWLNTLPAGADFDEGASLMLAKADGANIAPHDAMKWVEAISNPTLKFNSFAHVLVEWHQKNPAASQQYVARAEWLSDTQREKILNLLGQLP